MCNNTLDREGLGNNPLIQPAESGQLLGVREVHPTPGIIITGIYS